MIEIEKNEWRKRREEAWKYAMNIVQRKSYKSSVGGKPSRFKSDEDCEIYKRRITSNCFDLPNTVYCRKGKKLYSSDIYGVLDYHDGEYVNYIPLNIG